MELRVEAKNQVKCFYPHRNETSLAYLDPLQKVILRRILLKILCSYLIVKKKGLKRNSHS